MPAEITAVPTDVAAGGSGGMEAIPASLVLKCCIRSICKV